MGSSRLRGGVFAAALIGLLIGPAGAQAATRYATAGIMQIGANCSQSQPCALTKAIEEAADNDEVVVLPGTYTISSPINVGFVAGLNLNVHGVAGEARPRIVTTSGVGAFEALRLQGRSRLSRIEIDARDSGGRAAWLIGPASGAPQRVDDAIFRSSDGEPALLVGGRTEMHTALVRALGNGTALETNDGADVAINSSTIHSPDGTAAYVRSIAAATGVTVRNSVLRGGTSDLNLRRDGSTLDADLDASAVRAAEIVTFGSPNLTLGPTVRSITSVFADEEAGNLRLRPGTSAVDAGVVEPGATTTDIVGAPRVIGAASDFGAYEQYQAPDASTGNAVPGSPTTATLAATINPNGRATTYRFEVGTAGGGFTRLVGDGSALAAGTAPVDVGAPVDGLAPATAYLVRVVATNAEGTTTGAATPFTTPAAPAPADPAPTPAPPAPGLPTPVTPQPAGSAPAPGGTAIPGPSGTARPPAVVSIPAQGLRLDGRRRVQLRLRCSAKETATCRGTIELRTVSRFRVGRTRAVVRTARVRFAVRPGGTTRPRVIVSRAAAQVLRPSRTVSVIATVRTTGSDGRTRTATRRARLRTR